MLKKLRELNEQNKTIYFFGLMILLLLFLVFNIVSNREKENECTMPDAAVNSLYIYEYDIKITFEDQVVLLNVKRYGNKFLIEKTELGLLTSYYIYYSDVYKKNNETDMYEIYSDKNFINGIDNKYIYIDYLSEIIKNIDPTIEDDLTCYTKESNSFELCIDSSSNKLILEDGNYNLEYEFSNIGDLEDFTVDISE